MYDKLASRADKAQFKEVTTALRNLRTQFESELDGIQTHVRETKDRQVEMQKKMTLLKQQLEEGDAFGGSLSPRAWPGGSRQGSPTSLKLTLKPAAQESLPGISGDGPQHAEEGATEEVEAGQWSPSAKKHASPNKVIQLTRPPFLRDSPANLSRREKQELIDVKLLEFEENFGVLEDHMQKVQEVSW